MMKKHLRDLTAMCFFCLCLVCTHANGQQAPVSKLKNYATGLNNFRELKPVEKLYLQTDKPYYNAGDTLRFKGYLLNADFLTPSARSGLLYVELDDNQGKSTKLIMVPVISGMAWGDMALDTAEVPDGSYTLRAYTNWMRNFGKDYIFKKTINILKSADNPLLIKTNFKQEGNKVEGELLFSLLDGRIQAFRDVELKVMNGRSNLSKDKVVTNADGSVKVNFNIPEGTRTLSIQAATAGSNTLTIPVNINRKENVDVQFMPEGGSLVAGLAGKVGFKAIAEDGKGVSVSGRIIDSKGQRVVNFVSAHAGMGNFEFTPVAGEVYSAKIEGITKTYPLPAVKLSGTALSVKSAGKDSLRIQISSTADVKGAYYLIGQSRGVVCYAQTISTPAISKMVAKNLFATGIVRFSLINSANQPVNERIVFVNQHDQMNISVDPDKAVYGTRDSVALSIKVTDAKGNPIEGNFSLAVTDNSQVRPDSLAGNLLTNMLLTSDLKGHVEEPGYYFNGDRAAALDNLMLTQGWVGYDWQEVFHPKLPYAYKPQEEFTVSGKVTNALGAAVNKSGVVLITTRPFVFKDTLTGNDGRFLFKGLFPIDTAIYKIQAKNKRGKEFNVGITMDEIAPPVFGPAPLSTPWYLNTDTTLLNSSKTRVAEAQALSNFRGEGNILNEVNIKAKKIIPESKNLNGPGEADQIIDEKELKKAGKVTLLDLIQKKIPGFNIGSYTPPKREYPNSFSLAGYLKRDYPQLTIDGAKALADKLVKFPRPHIPWRQTYKVNFQEIHFIIDGMDLDYFFDDSQETIQIIGDDIIIKPNDVQRLKFVTSFLEYFTAEDITGIELMRNRRYTGKYDWKFDMVPDRMGQSNSVAYLEITTRAKKGPFMQITPGTYLFRTLPFTLARQFYSPRYTVKNKTTGMGTDLRSTIFWEPNVVTDKEGKATVSFFSADRAANYSVIIEGTDMNGQLGVGKQQIRLKEL